MKLAVMGYDWFVVDGYPEQAFWKSFIELKDRTLFGKLKTKKSLQ
jgi:hypothetical protein